MYINLCVYSVMDINFTSMLCLFLLSDLITVIIRCYCALLENLRNYVGLLAFDPVCTHVCAHWSFIFCPFSPIPDALIASSEW